MVGALDSGINFECAGKYNRNKPPKPHAAAEKTEENNEIYFRDPRLFGWIYPAFSHSYSTFV